ncbi:purine-nucleoside phosphorylase [Kordiimonas sp. SCSIO 12603]|uniref:purine-nucleoside phosphorylase n=1 Tax=Kordiimonas sp. SCSIO 12603 TaxID=2829596 RepID=UPI0021058CC4|nr:purine-nucleoside phosphorylase [Kordiimonas sp. SCSIO 12603]UTW58233.1 purine-nucleoside phosphorylase [Kordiimonas sp. SCSIO 12603]
MSYEDVQTCASFIREKLDGPVPAVAMVLGSGLNDLADSIENPTILSYADLPGFPKPTVEGHAGRMLIGKLGGKGVICMQGRAHAYEGHDNYKLAFSTRVLWALGVEILVLTNAAGSLDEEAGPGSLMAITDHINFSGVNPLVGINDERFGPRFSDMTAAWDKELTDDLRKCAEQLSIKLHEGTYLMAKGPNFETPAEIKAFRVWGANAVGMSTVPECLVARHCGMRVCGVSSITNYAAGMTGNELTHDETMEFGAIAAVNLGKLLKAFAEKVA